MLKVARFSGLLLALALGAGGSAWAYTSDVAPAPKKSPRTPVTQQMLDSKKNPLPASRNVAGVATIVDAEKLRIGDVELRLFGIVPPQLSASYGPQARAVVDHLNSGTGVACTIRDRDREGRFLATCQGSNGADVGLELLRRGLAVTARGSLRGTELAAAYETAETAAQAQRLGLWAAALPAAASDAAMKEVVQREEAAKAAAVEAAQKEKEAKEKEAAREAEEKAKEEAAAKEETAKPQIKPETPTMKATENLPPPLPLTPPSDWAEAVPETVVTQPSVLERYQLFFTGVLMLMTALGVLAAVVANRWLDRREELRSIAAALRGELMAARTLCLSRIASSKQDEQLIWPRVRTLVFQAYVSKLGLLGAELARQVASIYGQASDYAAYYSDTQKEPSSKKQALQTLVNHIDEVLPRLAKIEGANLYTPSVRFPTHLMTPSAHDAPPSPPGPGTSLPTEKPSLIKAAAAFESLRRRPATQESNVAQEPNETIAQIEEKPEAKEDVLVTAEKALADVQETAKKPVVTEERSHFWASLRRPKAATSAPPAPRKRDPMELQLPDYASMTEEELEIMAYNMGYGLEMTEEEEPATETKAQAAG